MLFRVSRIIKFIAMGLLLIALFLPISRCAVQNETYPSSAQPAESLIEKAPAAYRYNYAWTDFHPTALSSWLMILIFIWPLPFLVLDRISSRLSHKIWPGILQILLAAGSIYYLYLCTFLYELWYGGYIAYSALSLYLLVSIIELILNLRLRFRQSPSDGSRKVL
jgi:hypothetical protein